MTVYALSAYGGAMVTNLQGTYAIVFGVGGGPPGPVLVPQYRLLSDHYIGGVQYLAGTIVSEADALPYNWQPTPNVEPLNSAAATNFYNAGPNLPDLVRSPWSNIPKPVTYWKNLGGRTWALTGLGASFPSRTTR